MVALVMSNVLRHRRVGHKRIPLPVKRTPVFGFSPRGARRTRHGLRDPLPGKRMREGVVCLSRPLPAQTGALVSGQS